MDFAEKDWVSVIIDKSNVIVLARIVKIKRELQVTEQEIGGVIGMQTLRLLGGDAKSILPEFDLAFLQFKDVHRRIKSGNQGWNGIGVEAEKLIVLAAPSALWQTGIVVEPVAVSEVSSENDSLVRGIENALAIEKEADPIKQQTMLSSALSSDLPVLGSYAQFSVGPLKRMPREQAVELNAALALDQSASMSRRLSAVATLERSLWKNNAAEDILNKRIISVLLEFLEEPQPDSYHYLIPILYRLLITQVPEDAASADKYRKLLLREVVLTNNNALNNLKVTSSNTSLSKEASALISILRTYCSKGSAL